MYAYYVVVIDNNESPAKTVALKLLIAEEQITTIEHVGLLKEAAMTELKGRQYPVVLSWQRLPGDDQNQFVTR